MPDTYQVNSTTDPNAAMQSIATDLADVIKGYKTMVERADDDLRPFVERLLTLHETHAAEILEKLNKMGGHPENPGSFMGLVHEAVATARDWFDGLDTSVLSSIIDGEKRLIGAYDDAIERTAPQDECRNMLADQRATLCSHVDALDK